MGTVTGGEYWAMQFDLILWTIHLQLESSITFNCQNQKTRLNSGFSTQSFISLTERGDRKWAVWPESCKTQVFLSAPPTLPCWISSLCLLPHGGKVAAAPLDSFLSCWTSLEAMAETGMVTGNRTIRDEGLGHPPERSLLEFWRSCSPDFYQVVDLSTEGVDYNGCCNAPPMIRIRADDLIHPICWECGQQTSLSCQPSSGTASAEDSRLVPSLQLPSNGQFNPMSG
ncbi:uncharacterized protein [Eschrichtius robustus]|uniref:uncharacterized protein n=1 Tax=Eschrichtius robustus TaxID=9764 RepID=UPI0035C0061B